MRGLLDITILAPSSLDPPMMEINGLDLGHGKERVMLCGRHPLPQSQRATSWAKWLYVATRAVQFQRSYRGQITTSILLGDYSQKQCSLCCLKGLRNH